jgi:hypothetical protein
LMRLAVGLRFKRARLRPRRISRKLLTGGDARYSIAFTH